MKNKFLLIWLLGCSSLLVAQETDYEKERAAKAKASVDAIMATIDKAAAVWDAKKACDSGSALACNNLGAMYSNGTGVKQDNFKAVELYTKACDGGEVVGCGNLGVMYSNGIGVKQDYFKAVELYTKACDGGIGDGCSVLGNMYRYGTGVKQNKKLALKYYGMACDMKDEFGCESYAELKISH
ncbi:MAG: tetratricopeptide repeat protein [Sulfurimonas sp.]|uniref:tetratricopeptide repeat protein n=1 Tax=Sulfurimonas sp. TaxID=2022749 RepID=UPI0028CBC893|nr:tetratricopeptide repeat protein [Sulfurimonas sp.]MDT8338473.1 tetratricopeptide repeat protein [Sulfurimonas sp.]